MPKIKTGRSITVDSLCDFSEADKMQKVMLASILVTKICTLNLITLASLIICCFTRSQRMLMIMFWKPIDNHRA